MPARNAVNHWHSPGTSLHALSREPCPASQGPLGCSPCADPGLCFPATSHGCPPVSCSTHGFASPPCASAGGHPHSDWIPLPCLQSPATGDHNFCQGGNCAGGVRGRRSPAHKGHVSLPKPPLLPWAPALHGSRPCWSQAALPRTSCLPLLFPTGVLSPASLPCTSCCPDFLASLRAQQAGSSAGWCHVFWSPSRESGLQRETDSAMPHLPSQRCWREQKPEWRGMASLGC